MSKIWTVRGISDDIQKRVSEAAQAAGMRLGPWVERVLLDALEGQGGQGAPPDQGAAGDLAALVAAISATVDAHTEAIHVLFEHDRCQDLPAIVERLERLEAQAGAAIPGLPSGDSDKDRVPAAIPSRLGSSLDAVEPVGGVEVPETTETHPGASGRAGRRSPRKWTDADDSELRRIFDRGGNQADACREMDRPHSVISRKWATLLEERANRTLPSIELVRQADEMLKAGRPETEIAEMLKANRPPPEGSGT